MESQNLQTASLYINNLLLSRGLLRNGIAINFSDPTQSEGGLDGTMAKIINLVHDIVLRRDREAEHRESLALTIRTLRFTASKADLEIERLTSLTSSQTRSLALSTAQSQTSNTTLRNSERQIRSLREEMARMKTTVNQVRTSCATDIRKRDIQIQKLKSQLTTQQRGTRTPSTGSAISIVPTAASAAAQERERKEREERAADTSGYSLGQETNEFLTMMCSGMSDENDNLIGLIRSTLATLRDLQGLPAISNPAQQLEEEAQTHHASGALLTSYETLASDTEEILSHLRTLLTNPSFVPIDELEAREEEILRLREGWEKMESRWRDAVQMMDRWRKKISQSGASIDLEELKRGLGLGMGLGESVRPEALLGEDMKREDTEEDSLLDDADYGSDEEVAAAEVNHEELDVYDEAHEFEDGNGVGLRPDGRILAETSHNTQPRANPPRRAEPFSPIPEESTQPHDISTTPTDAPDFLHLSNENVEPARASRIPRQASGTHNSIQRKLAGAKREADAAEERRKRQDDRVEKSGRKTARPRAKGKGRRRSTLSPAELVRLIGAG